MLESQRQFVPIRSAASPRTQFDLTLPPYVDIDHIGVDLTQTDRLCNLGGINLVRVLSDNRGEISNFKPNVIGMTKSGEALAGKSGTSTQVPKFTVDNSPFALDSARTPHPLRWVDTTITINTPETQRLIAEEPQWNTRVRSPEAWASHINDALKHGIKRAGTRHLLLGLSRENWKNVAGMYTGIFIGLEAQKINAPEAVVATLFCFSVANCLTFLDSKVRSPEFRLSLIYGPQLDRALVLALSSLKTPLVKAIPEK